MPSFSGDFQAYLRVALWFDEPFAPVDATLTAAVRKAAFILEEAGAIVDDPRARRSFEEAWEVFAALTHVLTGASLPDKAGDKLAAREHDFLTGDLSRSASARDAPEHAGFHRHSGAASAASPGGGTIFRT